MQKGVLSWHNRSVVIVSEEGDTQSDATSKAGPSAQAAWGETRAGEGIIASKNGTGAETVRSAAPGYSPRVLSSPLQHMWDGKWNFLAK